jgi:thiol-disulfide isomerase/thioredoxin
MAQPFPDVQIPAMISDQQEALNYLAENYWDGLTDTSRNYPCDSLYVSGVEREVVEQKFADWTLILDYVDITVARKAVGKLYDRAYACEKNNPESNVFEMFADLASKYFYDPNSPMRNEDYYLPFVSKYASYEGLSEAEKGKYEREARLCGFNKFGTKAADFRFSDKNGKMRNLYDIKAPYTLLFFSNPGCEACMQIINVLKGEPAIAQMVADKTLAVLNIYIDEDIQAWRSYMPIYPEEWYNGFDPDFVLRSNEIYAVRAIPSLYLLDNEKRVILKDAPENKLFNFLFRI